MSSPIVLNILTRSSYNSGTIVFGNVWCVRYWLPKYAIIEMIVLLLRAMTRDEDVYPEPSLFKPERFLDQNGCINDDKHILAYGFGRR